jgi:hypothetical protein
MDIDEEEAAWDVVRDRISIEVESGEFTPLNKVYSCLFHSLFVHYLQNDRFLEARHSGGGRNGSQFISAASPAGSSSIGL